MGPLPGFRSAGWSGAQFCSSYETAPTQTSLISAVGADEFGEEAVRAITALGLDTSFLQITERFKTGTASVQLGPCNQTSFVIERPAAYDAVELSDSKIQQIINWQPDWFYYGTLFPSSPGGKDVLCRLLQAVPRARRLYVLNLRPGSESADLVSELLRTANVVKLNEEELKFIHEFAGLPAEM